MEEDQERLYERYEEILELGVARELARINLPLSLYTEWYWQIDLHNLFHFLRLRMDEHAQYEIRCYALALARCAKAVAPMAYEAFEEHILNSVRFSRSECAALLALLEGREVEMEERPKRVFDEKLQRLKKIGGTDKLADG
jgi:thymidylate synthase (FAD)